MTAGNQVKSLIKQVQYSTGMTIAEISERIGYQREYVSRVMNKPDLNGELIEGRLRNEFKTILTDMYTNPSLSQNAKVVRPAREDDNRIADLEKRVQEIERKLAEMQGQLTLIASLLRR
jgi:DNA-binding transcriptional MerR regulator